MPTRAKSILKSGSTHGHKQPKDGSDIRAVDVLVDRSQQWKHITKSLLHYYKGLSAIETTTAKATSALTETIQVPFHEGNNFLGEGGWQEVLYTVRDKTKVLAEHHNQFASTIDHGVVAQLEHARSDLKAHIARIEKDATALADEVSKERATSATHLTTLQQSIDTYENSDDHMLPQHDPVLYHSIVKTQLTKQVHKENEAQAALIRYQQEQPDFESKIAKSLQAACKSYDEAKAVKLKEIEQTQSEIADALQSVAPDAEYNFYSSKEGNVLDPNTPPRAIEHLNFPGLNHPSTQSIKEGPLERKKRFTKTYKEAYYILSPSGFLHEKKDENAPDDKKPGFSIFLPETSLGPAGKETDKSHKFHLEGNKAVKSSMEGKFKHKFFGGKEIAYAFRARSHAEMLSWWTEMDKLSRDTKTAPIAGTRPSRQHVTPIAAAVANVGYEQPKVEPTTSVADTPISQGGIAPALTKETSEGAVAGGVPAQDPEIAAEEAREKREAEQEEENRRERQTATSDAVTNVGKPALGAQTGHHATAAEAEEEEYEDDEEEGGSSAEEEEEEHRIARTAPSTPGVGLVGEPSLTHENHAHKHEEATGVAETLPVYSGDGTSAAEQQAAQGEKKGLFSSIFGGKPNNVVPEQSVASADSTAEPVASTSHNA